MLPSRWSRDCFWGAACKAGSSGGLIIHQSCPFHHDTHLLGWVLAASPALDSVIKCCSPAGGVRGCYECCSGLVTMQDCISLTRLSCFLLHLWPGLTEPEQPFLLVTHTKVRCLQTWRRHLLSAHKGSSHDPNSLVGPQHATSPSVSGQHFSPQTVLLRADGTYAGGITFYQQYKNHYKTLEDFRKVVDKYTFIPEDCRQSIAEQVG